MKCTQRFTAECGHLKTFKNAYLQFLADEIRLAIAILKEKNDAEFNELKVLAQLIKNFRWSDG